MILTIGYIKDGVGKSSLACNIAVALSFQGKGGDVLLIDGDKQRLTADFAQSRADLLSEAGFTCVRAQGKEVINQVVTMWDKFAHIVIDAGGQDNPSLRAGAFGFGIKTTQSRCYRRIAQSDKWIRHQSK